MAKDIGVEVLVIASINNLVDCFRISVGSDDLFISTESNFYQRRLVLNSTAHTQKRLVQDSAPVEILVIIYPFEKFRLLSKSGCSVAATMERLSGSFCYFVSQFLLLGSFLGDTVSSLIAADYALELPISSFCPVCLPLFPQIRNLLPS